MAKACTGAWGFGDQVFAVTTLGAGWVIDIYASQKRADELAQQRLALQHADYTERCRAVAEAIEHVRPGRQAERLLWAIQQHVLAAESSVVRIPDEILAQAVWGRRRYAWPRHWRRDLIEVLEGLTWLHIATSPPTELPSFGAETALLTHVADLRGNDDDVCDADCPRQGGQSHHHYLLNVGRGLLGLLERLVSPDDGSGVRTYDFAKNREQHEVRALRRLGKTGRLVSYYLPAKLGDPDRCGLLTPRQHSLIQAMVRETTRAALDRRLLACRVEIQAGNQIPDLQGRKGHSCPFLDAASHYVGFNGNKKRKGLGYRLLTPGGWLAKAGYAPSELRSFLRDLAVLEKNLGLQAIGVERTPGSFYDLERLQALEALL